MSEPWSLPAGVTDSDMGGAGCPHIDECGDVFWRCSECGKEEKDMATKYLGAGLGFAHVDTHGLCGTAEETCPHGLDFGACVRAAREEELG